MKAKTTIISIIMAVIAGSASAQLAPSPKSGTANNPLCPYNFIADATAVEYNGRIYVYGTNDQQEFDITQGKSNNTYGKIKQLVCISSADLVNWTFHGTIDVGSICPWIATSWAPSIVSREESDGLTHFYMYFTNTASGIGVITSTSPVGPWKDPLGHALIDGRTPGRGTMSNIIDPGAMIDENGTGWLTFGGGDVNSQGTSLLPGNARIVKLGKDMISLSSDIKKIPAPFHFEANELNKIGDKYVFSYSTNWADHVNDWKTYSGKGSYAAPSTCSIIQMTTTDPLDESSWKYDGEVVKNPGAFGYPWGNNHTHMQEYAGGYYMLYHTQWLENKLGVSGGYRCLAINSVKVNPNEGKIPTVTCNDEGAAPITSRLPKAFEVCQAECMSQGGGFTMKSERRGNMYVLPSTGGWTMVRSMSFSELPKSLTARVSGKGTIEVRIGSNTSTCVASASFNSKELTDVVMNIDTNNRKVKMLTGGKTADVCIVFTEASNVKFDCWNFNTQTVEEISAISLPEKHTSQSERIYNLSGQRMNAPTPGIKIINGKKVVVR